MLKKFRTLLLGTVLTAAAASAGVVVIATAPPPPVRMGVVGVAPGPGFVWVEGYHVYRHGRYVWMPGRWMRPPRPRAVWVAPRYDHVRGGYVFVGGHWR